MREWDEMIARQVSADGVRTTWGEHVAPPGGEVTMTDDRILTPDEMAAWWSDGQTDTVTDMRVWKSHEALRAALEAAKDDHDAGVAMLQHERAARIAAEAERDAARQFASRAEGEWARNQERAERAEAERDRAIRERDAWKVAHDIANRTPDAFTLTAQREQERLRANIAEAQVVTLTEALREAQQCLYRDGANAAGEVKALLDAALAAADQTDEGGE